MPEPSTDPSPTPPKGPIDPLLLRISPALRRHLIVSAVLAVTTTVVVLAQAELVARELPRLVAGDGAAVAPLVEGLVMVALALGTFHLVGEVSGSAAVAGTRRAITDLVLDRAESLDEDGVAAAPPARLTALITSGVDALDVWIRSYVPALCLAAVLPLAAWIRILLAWPVAAGILAVAIPLIPVFMILIGRLTQDRADRQWAGLQRLAGHFHDVLVGLPTLRLFGRADAQAGRVREVSARYRSAVMQTLKVAFLSAFALELLATLSVALVAVSVGAALAAGHVTLGTALVVLLLAPECALPLRRVGAAYHAGIAGTDAAAELREVLELTSSPDGTATDLPPGPLRIDGVRVTDAGRGVRLPACDLVVEPGEIVALTGPSGAGKTTLVDVVRGRLAPDGGSVRIGATSLDDLTRARRQAAVAWVPQLPGIVGGPVEGATRLGAPGAGPADVDALLERLGLGPVRHHAVAELSGGQRQRVAVARAVLRATESEARVVVADEPTSHQDDRSAAAVVAELRALADGGRPVLVVTHDPRVVAAADRAVALPSAGPVDDLTTARAASDPPASSGDDHRAVPEQASAPSTRAANRPMAAVAPPALLAPAQRAWRWGRGGDLRWFRAMGASVRGPLLRARALGVLADGFTIGLAATAAWLIARASEHPPFAALAVAAVAVRTFGIGKGVVRYLERLASHDATFRLLEEVRASVVSRLARIAPAGVPGLGRGELTARVVDDVDGLADLELRVVGPAVSAIAVGVLTAVGAGLVAPEAGLVLAGAVVVVGLILPALAARVAARSVAPAAQARAGLASGAMDLVEHLDEVSANGATAAWRAPIGAEVGRLGAIERATGWRLGLLSAVAAAAPALTVAGVAAVTGAAGGGVGGPALAVLVLVPFALVELLAPLVEGGRRFALVRAAAVRLHDLLAAPDPILEPAAPAPLPPSTEVVAHDLAVRWPGAERDAVRDLDLVVAEGGRIAVLGPSGSGKSTVAAALVRFVERSGGALGLGGTDVRALRSDDVRTEVTWCPQDPWLAATSVRENLALAQPGVDDDALWAVLERVHLAAWARQLPDGLDTWLGRDGSAMSGGQRQRLALARVLLADHRVVVLDEPTAHLDGPTARAVLADLLDALADRSVVLLAHDRSAVPADFAVVELAGPDTPASVPAVA